MSADGQSYSFDPAEPALARLRPGSILFIWGVALRKVVAVETRDGLAVVRTAPAALQEAIADGEIEFESAVALRRHMVVPFVPAPAEAAPRTSRSDTPRIVPVGLRLAQAGSAGAGEGTGNEEPRQDGPHHFKGSVKGIQYSLAFTPGEAGLGFDLQLRKGDDGDPSGPQHDPAGDMRKEDAKKRAEMQKEFRAMRPEGQDESARKSDKAAREYKKDRADPWRDAKGKARQELFDIASELLDLRIKADGVLQGVDGSDKITVFGHMVFKDGAVSLLHSQFRNISGTVNVQYIIRRGDASTQWIEKMRVEVPLTFNIPIVVGGLPLTCQVRFALIAAPALATKRDAFRGAFSFKFGGSGGTRLVGNQPSAEAQMNGEGTAKDAQASSIGVSAILVALQAPRVGLGLGLFGASTIGYIDSVISTSATSGGTLGMIPCKRWTAVWTMNAGIDAQVAMLHKDFRREPPLLKKDWEKVEPPIKACQIGSG